MNTQIFHRLPSEKSMAYQHQAVSLLAKGFSSISGVILEEKEQIETNSSK